MRAFQNCRTIVIFLAIFTSIQAISKEIDKKTDLPEKKSVQKIIGNVSSITALPSVKDDSEFAEMLAKPPLADCLKKKDGKESKVKTFAWACVKDGKELCISIKAFEPDMKSLKGKTTEHDGNIWDDDYVGIYLDLSGSAHTFKQILINPRGTVYDALCYSVDYVDKNWNCDIQPIVSKGDGFWEVKVNIPFEKLGIAPDGSDIIGLNFERNRRVGFEDKKGFQGPPSEKSFWNPVTVDLWADILPAGSILLPVPDPIAYNKFRISSSAQPGLKVSGITRGSLGQNFPEDNVFKFEINNDSGKDARLSVCVVSDNGSVDLKTDKYDILIEKNAITPFSVRYEPNVNATTMRFSILDESTGGTVYSSRYGIIPLRPERIEIPEYNEDPILLEKKTEKILAGKSCACWLFEWVKGRFMIPAVKFAFPHSQEKWFDIAKENHLLPIFTAWRQKERAFNSIEEWADTLRKQKLSVAYYPNLYDVKNPPYPIIDGRYPFLADPRAHEFARQQIREVFSKYGDTITSFFIGDEIEHLLLKSSRSMFWDNKGKYPQRAEIDAMLKDKYGYGKYGLPESLDDKNRFRWLVYWKWFCDEVDSYRKTVSSEVRNIRPDIIIHSTDPQGGGIHPLDFWRWGDTCNIVHHQIGIRPKYNNSEVEFTTKLLRDLSGVDEVWTCSHTSDYMTSWDDLEARELMSRSFRCGATGMLMYQYSSHRRDIHTSTLSFESICAPGRWNIQMAAVKLYNQGLRVKQPSSDVAFLISYDSWQANPIFEGESRFLNAFQMLGPKCGAWFKLIDDRSIESGRTDISKYRVIFVPYADIENDNVVSRLQKAAEEGATLVITDPKAFRYRPDGSERTIPVFKGEGDAVCLKTPAGKLKKWKEGKGTVFWFDLNPFEDVTNKNWKTYFHSFLADLKIKTDEKIWSVTLPIPIKTPAVEKGLCLTNNHIQWKDGSPLLYANLPVSGKYRYDRQPDGDKDFQGNCWIDFASGKLTDRVRNLISRSVKLKDFSVSYENSEPFSIEIDMGNSYDLQAVNIWIADTKPAISLMPQNDKGMWTEVAVSPEIVSQDGVGKFSLVPSAPVSSRFLKILFGKRPYNTETRLVEIEIWAIN